MIGREKRVLLRHYLEQGMTKAAIARHVGVSHDTIYCWIATGQLDRDLDEEVVRYRPRRRTITAFAPVHEREYAEDDHERAAPTNLRWAADGGR